MDHVPAGSVLLLVLVDLFLIYGFSGLFGGYIARAAGSPAWLGVLAGLVFPLLGPLVWAGVAVARRPRLAGLSGSQVRVGATWISAALLGSGAVLFLVATPFAWGDVSGAYDDYALATDASPVDTVVGFIGTIGTALVLGLLAVLLVFTTAWRRVALVAGWVAACWLLVTLDSLIVLSALDGTAEDLNVVSGGRVAVDAEPAGALWACLIGAILVLVGAVVIMLRASPHGGRVVDGGGSGAGQVSIGDAGPPDVWATPGTDWATPRANEWGKGPGGNATW